MPAGILEVIDKDNRNEFFDIGEEIVAAPHRDDIVIRDRDEMLIRLDSIKAPRQRLKEFLLSHFFINDGPTHDAKMVRYMGISGLLFGWMFGGLARSRGVTEQYIRQHNASVFDGKHRAKRGFVDNYVYTILRRGAKFGVGCFIFSTSAGLIGFGSIAYRNQLYYPDWLVGFAALGAVSRCWLGLRGVVVGAGFGLAAGVLGYGFAKTTEKLTGHSVTQLRWIRHQQYLIKQEARLNAQQKMRVENDKEFISPFLR